MNVSRTVVSAPIGNATVLDVDSRLTVRDVLVGSVRVTPSGKVAVSMVTMY